MPKKVERMDIEGLPVSAWVASPGKPGIGALIALDRTRRGTWGYNGRDLPLNLRVA